MSLDTFLSPSDVAALRAPIESAKTFPRAAYTSEEFFQHEIERIFRRHWIGLCFAASIPEPGDVLPLEICGIPLLAVRGDDKLVRVFHNVCPYDGCPLVFSHACGLQEIVGRYHGWRYDLRGRLIAIPYWNGEERGDPAALGPRRGDLVEVKSGAALGIVFIDLDGGAGPLEHHVRPVLALMQSSGYRTDELVLVGDDDSGRMLRQGIELRTNWKTYIENAGINVLHEAFTHELYRKSPEVPRVREGKRTYFIQFDGHLIAFGYSQADVRHTYPPLDLPHIGCTASCAPDKGYFLTLYPNVVIPLMPAARRTSICLPIAPDHLRLLRCSFVHPSATGGENFPQLHRSLVDGFAKALREDRVVLEGIQRARRSPVSGRHFYAAFWDEPHHYFNRLIVDDLESRQEP